MLDSIWKKLLEVLYQWNDEDLVDKCGNVVAAVVDLSEGSNPFVCVYYYCFMGYSSILFYPDRPPNPP